MRSALTDALARVWIFQGLSQEELARAAGMKLVPENVKVSDGFGVTTVATAVTVKAASAATVTPFGQTGPKAAWADADVVILAAGGPLSLTGDDDRPRAGRNRAIDMRSRVRKLGDKPQHQHAFAETRARLAHRLHRDRSQRRVSRLPVLHAIGNRSRQQVRHRDHLRMKRALRTAARHQ